VKSTNSKSTKNRINDKQPTTAKTVGVFFLVWFGMALVIGLITGITLGYTSTGGLIAFIIAIVITVKYKNGGYSKK
jgi:uncharacterized membrane protein